MQVVALIAGSLKWILDNAPEGLNESQRSAWRDAHPVWAFHQMCIRSFMKTDTSAALQHPQSPCNSDYLPKNFYKS